MAEFFQTLWPYLTIFFVMTLTGVGLPIPEEAWIIGAGILSANGTLNPWLAFGCLLAGALLGDCIMYYIGYHFGRGILKDHRWWARFLTPQREARIEEKFRKHGLGVFFVARFLVGIRSAVYITAGILRVSFKRFLLIDLICAAAVVGAFFALSWWKGEAIAKSFAKGEYVLTVVVTLAVIVLAIFLWQRHAKKKTAAKSDSQTGSSPGNDP